MPAPPAVVTQLLHAVETDPTRRLTDKDLVGMGIDPSTARRRFRVSYGMTFQAYQRARRGHLRFFRRFQRIDERKGPA